MCSVKQTSHGQGHLVILAYFASFLEGKKFRVLKLVFLEMVWIMESILRGKVHEA